MHSMKCHFHYEINTKVNRSLSNNEEWKFIHQLKLLSNYNCPKLNSMLIDFLCMHANIKITFSSISFIQTSGHLWFNQDISIGQWWTWDLEKQLLTSRFFQHMTRLSQYWNKCLTYILWTEKGWKLWMKMSAQFLHFFLNLHTKWSVGRNSDIWFARCWNDVWDWK